MKIHPLLRLVATQPHLLADHAEAYAGLVGEELGKTSAELKRRAILGLMALVLLLIGMLLGGVSLLLWSVTPPANMNAPWALVAVPAVPLLIAVGCAFAARGDNSSQFSDLRQQLAADLALLREAGAT